MQQYVCPGMQQMRLRRIKPNANAATARITRRELQQRLFQRFFTLTNYANLQVWVLIQRYGYRLDRHVGHLLAGQATAHYQYCSGGIWIQPKNLLQFMFAGDLVGQPPHTECVPRHVVVGLWRSEEHTSELKSLMRTS